MLPILALLGSQLAELSGSCGLASTAGDKLTDTLTQTPCTEHH